MAKDNDAKTEGFLSGPLKYAIKLYSESYFKVADMFSFIYTCLKIALLIKLLNYLKFKNKNHIHVSVRRSTAARLKRK